VEKVIRLARQLEQLREKADHGRCIQFKMPQPLDANSRPAVIHAVTRHLPSENQQVYFCDDGDFFILAPAMPTRDANRMIDEIATHIGITPTEELVSLYELNPHVNKLLVMVEEKLARKQSVREELARQQAEAEAERKRRQILKAVPNASRLEDIAARRRARSKPEIVVIEDDAFTRRLVENTLQKQFNVTTLGTAELALFTYARLAPDLVLLDINLPDVTGHQLLERIIEMDPQSYVVMLSANADMDNIRQAMTHGAKGFIAKPFTRDKLFQYIDRCPTIKQ